MLNQSQPLLGQLFQSWIGTLSFFSESCATPRST